MRNYANEIITKVMPKVFDLLKYPENKIFYLLFLKIIFMIIKWQKIIFQYQQ